MTGTERPSGQAEQGIKAGVIKGVNRAIRRYRPTLMVPDVASIPWDQFDKGNGVHAVIDNDATLKPLFGWDVPERYRESIAEHRRRGTIREASILTNSAPRDEIGFMRLRLSGEQIDANRTLVPLRRSQRKPNADMPLIAVACSDAKDAAVVVVGDKLTGDISAGNLAGADATVLVDKHGDPELFGDRFRRVIEAAMKWWMRRVPDDVVDKPADTPIMSLRKMMEEGLTITPSESPKRKYSGKIPAELWLNSNISGHGAPIVELPQQVMDTIPPRINIPGMKEAKRLAKSVAESKIGQEIEEVVYQHGGVIGDYMSLSRIKDGIEILINLKKKKPNIKEASRIHTKSMFKDVGDGTAVRNSERGPTPKGAIYDLIGDRALDFFTGWGTVAIGRLSKLDFHARNTREIGMFLVRYYYNKKGIDIKANAIGKASTLFVMPASNLALRAIAEKRPELNKKIQRSATIIKVASFLYSWGSYHRQAKFREQDMPRYEEEEARLISQNQDKN